ncbi:MAG: FKBP-type peptidyl-prolyl cis-trans isomerase [Opitutaceae bacterium]|nr:FKBP-type peptidyl-prolyl cis-trans isomerase [Opitutaceae bacterium]MBP9911867.1 FKBP-type peptidyl-prolyl cis-trans isomerase [Opitutaceae bacterium]
MKITSLVLMAAVVAMPMLAADTPAEFTTTASGLKYVVTASGTGPLPHEGQVVIAHYTGTLEDGTEFDSSRGGDQPFAFTLGKKQVIKGWDEGFALLHVGDKATLIIPSGLAYGDKPRGKIPANSTLRFDVELVGLKEHALADLLRETIDTAGLEAAQARFADLKDKTDDYYLSEGQLNGLGYHYLQHDKAAEALAVFQWTVAAFPNSGNAYDSLGEAWVKQGDRAAAIANYEKSFALDPTNKNAEKMLAELKATEDGPAALSQMQARMELDTAMTAAFDASDKDVYDVPALHAKVAAFLEKYPDDRTAESVVGNLFYYAESVGLPEALAEWQSFLNHPNAKLRARAEQKMKVGELLKAPIGMSFTAADGREVDVAKLRGKVVLIDFWAVWCPPCREEIPNVVAAYEKYHDQGFEVVGISFDRAPDAAKPWKSARTAAQVLKFTQQNGMPWPQFYDGSYWDNPYGKQYGIRGIPAMFLLDQNGMVVSLNARGPKLEKEVRRLLGLPAL